MPDKNFSEQLELHERNNNYFYNAFLTTKVCGEIFDFFKENQTDRYSEQDLKNFDHCSDLYKKSLQEIAPEMIN